MEVITNPHQNGKLESLSISERNSVSNNFFTPETQIDKMKETNNDSAYSNNLSNRGKPFNKSQQFTQLFQINETPAENELTSMQKDLTSQKNQKLFTMTNMDKSINKSNL